jgi:RNase P subunit RPR2
VDTPTTLSPSPPSIRPTHFTRASPLGLTESKKLKFLEHELRGVSDNLIRELLIRSGRQHLLAIPKDAGCDLPCESEKVSSPKNEMIERRLERYVDKIIERRLEQYVNKMIERRLEQDVDRAMSECRDQIYDVYTMNEAEFREQVDDGNSEVRSTANECINEIMEQAQKCMLDMEEEAQKYTLDMEEQAQQYMKDIEDLGMKVEMSAGKKLKRWFNASAQPLLDRKSSASHGLGANARRSSI